MEEEEDSDGSGVGDDRWMSLTANSFLQGSNLESQSVSQLAGTNLDLGDLSCSLLHCGGGKDDNDNEDEDEEKHKSQIESVLKNVDHYVEGINKRDKLIASLVSSLTNVLKQKEEGDSLLISVENQLEQIEEVRNSLLMSRTLGSENNERNSLFHSTLLDEDILLDVGGDNGPIADEPCTPIPSCKASEKQQPGAIITTRNQGSQIDNATSTATIPIPKKTFRNVSTSVSPKISNTAIANANANNEIQTTDNTQPCNNPGDGENANFDENEDDFDMYGSPKQVNYPPVNPDSLRLTFSPSICEYEAEGADHSSRSSAIIDDLRLQVSDTERKLEATRKYLEEMTAEREQEREDFQRTINDLALRYEETRKEKEKAESIIEQQRFEINDMEEAFNKNEHIQDQLLNKVQTSEYELKHAIEKIFELREIIRTLEEQVEATTKEATILSEYRRGMVESIQEESRMNVSASELGETAQGNKDDASVFDHTEELQAQVYELAKKIEDKLSELENFPWHTRPSSSCSVKSDDVSVRGAACTNDQDESAAARDFVSQIFGGLRRLECSFDSLVRFEEVLLKKLKDAELKFSLENKQCEDLKIETTKLRCDLTNCRKKIEDFEGFLKGNKKANSSSQFSSTANSPSIEALRATSFSHHQFNKCSPLAQNRIKNASEAEAPPHQEEENETQADVTVEEESELEAAGETGVEEESEKYEETTAHPEYFKEQNQEETSKPDQSQSNAPPKAEEMFQMVDKRKEEGETELEYGNTKVSKSEMDDNENSYTGSQIIRPEETYGIIEDAKESRLEGTVSQIAHEIAKTKEDQMLRALEAERKRNRLLQQQMAQTQYLTTQGDHYGKLIPSSYGNLEARLQLAAQQIGDLENCMHEKNRAEGKLRLHLQCALATLERAREENVQYCSYIEELERKLEYDANAPQHYDQRC